LGIIRFSIFDFRFSIGDYSIFDFRFSIFDWDYSIFDFGFSILDFGLELFDFGFWIGIIGVNLIFKPIINLKSDARILLSHPLLPGGGGTGGRSGERKHPR
jgi:hypothetical protein